MTVPVICPAVAVALALDGLPEGIWTAQGLP